MPESGLYAANLPLAELCLVEPPTVWSHAVSRGRVTASDTVLVFESGGIGLGAVVGTLSRGASVTAVHLDRKKLEIVRGLGAHETIEVAEEDVALRVLELTNNRGPDVVVEAVGSVETFRQAVELVAFAGRVVHIGSAKQPVSYETKLFVQKELDIVGSRNELATDFLDVISILEAERFPIASAISAVEGIDEAPAMLERWSSSPGSFTKILIEVDV